MAEDGKIIYKVTLDDTGVEAEAESKGKKLGNALATGAKAVGGAAVAIGTAAAAAGTAIVKATGELADYGDSIDKMSQKVGMSTDAYQEWDYILKISGTEMASMTTGLKTLTNQLDAAKNGSESAQGMFKALGLSMDDLATMSREDVFSAVVSGFQGMADTTERAALANDLFGKSGQELTPLFNTSVAETEALKKKVHDLGGVMSGEAVKASADYQDTLTDMQTAMKGVSNQLIGEFLPNITTIMEGITELFSGDSEQGITLVSQGLNDMLTNMIEMLPNILDAGGQIALNLIEGLIQNLPQFAETGVTLLVKLLNGISSSLPRTIPVIITVITTMITCLLQHLPEIISAGIQILVALIQGLINALPQLIAMLPTIVQTIVNVLLQNLPQVIQAAIQIITAIISGLIQALPQLIAALPQIISAIINAFRNTDWRSIGSNIVSGIWNGIQSLWGQLVNAVSEGVSNLWRSAKNALGISSPSKKFKYIGEMSVEGMEEGFEEGEDDLEQTVHHVYDSMLGAAGGTGTGRGAMEQAVSYSLQATGRASDTTIVVPLSIDGREIARATAWSMGEQLAWQEM